MSTHPAIILLCDFGEECESGEIISPSSSTMSARELARAAGWKRLGERDFCPKHLDTYEHLRSRLRTAHVAQTPPTPYTPQGMTDIMIVCEQCEIEWGWGISAEAAEAAARGHNETVHKEDADAEQ